MVNIHDYLRISDAAKSVLGTFTDGEQFRKDYWSIYGNERMSFLRYYILNNQSFAFKDAPLLFERITQYIADKLRICPTEVKLIGSAKTGFSISPQPSYGRPFGLHSDLDFSIVNRDLFEKIRNEYTLWVDKYQCNDLVPRSNKEQFYWDENLKTGTNQLKRGFFDTNKIPNRPEFENIKKINNSLSLVTINLTNIHSIKIKKSSASVYKDWESLSSRIKHNTESILKTLK